jgi:hypothetical protein
MRCQAHGLGESKVNLVQAVGGAVDLSDEVVIPAQHAVVDEHLTTSLVKLPDADDVAPELGDEAHLRVGAVLTVLALEDDGAALVNLHA